MGWFGFKSTGVLSLRNRICMVRGNSKLLLLQGLQLDLPSSKGKRPNQKGAVPNVKEVMGVWRKGGMSSQHPSVPPPEGATSQVLQSKPGPASRPALVTLGYQLVTTTLDRLLCSVGQLDTALSKQQDLQVFRMGLYSCIFSALHD